ncbi:MAG TPA: helix-turn-helix domain-containing protein [Conexibacter sp.]|nr:helix-turn-helix domain-containing protein [Conexibacter sp.]
MALAEQSDAEAVDVRVVKALAHPTRVRILDVLRDRELVSPVELADELGLALGTVGYHVRRLETLGFIELAKQTQRRGAVEHHYRACAELDPLHPVPAAAPGASAEHAVRANAIVREAQEAVARGGFDAVATRSDRRMIAIDAPGRVQLAAAVDDLLSAIERIEQASAQRLAASRTGAIARTAVVLVFDADGLDRDVS